MIEEHNESWEPGDDSVTLISQIEQDRHAGRMTESDVIHIIQALFLGTVTVITRLGHLAVKIEKFILTSNALVINVSLGGADTTATTMKNMVLNLARYPTVQQRCFDELQSRNFHCPNMKDCSYLLAVIWESYRYSTSMYRPLMHSVTEPTEILGFGPLQKDDLVACSLMGIHMSDKYFKNPYQFDPDRFLVKGVFHKDENLLPFNIGKRSCPGQILANLEIFHFTKNLLR